uniref:Uncharacterized protein n=1 Tax=Bursaphelenchus xylophilus TaxID=6326 RepID=A0A1I7SB85_BURXY
MPPAIPQVSPALPVAFGALAEREVAVFGDVAARRVVLEVDDAIHGRKEAAAVVARRSLELFVEFVIIFEDIGHFELRLGPTDVSGVSRVDGGVCEGGEKEEQYGTVHFEHCEGCRAEKFFD